MAWRDYTVSVVCQHGTAVIDDNEVISDQGSLKSSNYYINSVRVIPDDGWMATRFRVDSSGTRCHVGYSNKTLNNNAWSGSSQADRRMSWCSYSGDDYGHADIVITIHFEQVQPTLYSISTLTNPIGSGTTSGGGLYEIGASCTISVVPIQGYRFKRWTSDLGRTQTEKTATITVIGNEVWTAKLIATTGLILYLPSNNKVLYRPSNDKIIRDE